MNSERATQRQEAVWHTIPMWDAEWLCLDDGEWASDCYILCENPVEVVR